MITIHYKKIRSTALVLLMIPALIFFLGWLKLYIGIPCALLLAVGVFLASKCEDREIKIKKSTLLALGALILIWAFLSGQGGFFTQKRDYEFRNVVFRDLINYSWPVRYKNDNNESLVYYIGYWLLPALVGKLGLAAGGFKVGWLAARIAILVWTVVLLYTSFLLVLFYIGKGRKKAVYIAFAVFVLFSGMDAVGAITVPQKFLTHIEWWAAYYQFSSMSTQLCWVFNQAVPAWLACALAFNEKDEKSFALIGLLLLPTSPFPLVGLAAYMLVVAVRSFVASVKNKTLGDFFKSVFTPQNIIAVITLVPVFGLYYYNNTASASVSEAANNAPSGGISSIFAIVDQSPAILVVMYVLFALFEFGFLLLVLRSKERKFEFYFVLISLLIIPLVTVGYSIDFCMRASIPALFLLMLLLIEYLTTEFCRPKAAAEEKKSPEYKKRAQKLFTVMLIFIIGCATPLVEYTSSAREFIQTKGECVTKYDYMETLDDITFWDKVNFVGVDSDNTPFFKYLARK